MNETKASANECKHKIKTSFARIIVIIVEGTPEKPYYNIEYFDPTDKEYHIGFGSYCLDNVLNWLAEEFEITEPTNDCISRKALLDRYDAEHVGPPGRARELIETAPTIRDGLLLPLPCRIGHRIFRVVDSCTSNGDCATKMKCNGCEYRRLFIEPCLFHLYLLTDEGKLRRGYYCTYAEAKKEIRSRTGES